MRLLYTVLFYLLTPFLWLRLLWRARTAPDYAKRWSERVGIFSPPPMAIDLWIHAVSLGEVIASEPLVRRIQQQHPTWQIAITTTTPTGSKRVKQSFDEAVFHVYLPFDYPGAIRRLLKRLQPRRLLIMETEIWPNLFHYTARANIPIVIGNARLSEKSLRGYRWIGRLIWQPLQQVAQVAAQSAEDAKRFEQLGVPIEKIQVVGNIKFDIQVPEEVRAKGKKWRSQWGEDRRVVMAASTHPGEEEQVLTAWQAVKKQFPQALLILVPRHPERSPQLLALCEKFAKHTVLKTQLETVSTEKCQSMDILLGDTMGEMLALYASADIAFVGGSLVPHGGHNILEPAALTVPIISGPHTFNFFAIMQLFTNANAISIVNNSQQLSQVIIDLLADRNLRQQYSQSATKILELNRGAVAKHLALLEQ